MNAPPVLRPLRAILQRRLQIVPPRPTQTPHYVRASQYRCQLRYNSSISPDDTPKPDNSAQAASNERALENAATPSEGSPRELQVDDNSQASEVAVEAGQRVSTNFEIPGHGAPNTLASEPAVPRLDGLFVKSAFQRLKAVDEEIQAGIAEAVVRQLVAEDASAAAHAAALEAQEAAMFKKEDPEVAEPLVADVAESLASDTVIPEVPADQEPDSRSPKPENNSTQPTPTENAQATAAVPGLEMFANASTEELAALMAHLQQLQATKNSVSATTPEQEQAASEQAVSQGVTPESVTPETPTSEAVASMTEPTESSTKDAPFSEPSTSSSPSPKRGVSMDSILEDLASEAEANAALYEELQGAGSGVEDVHIPQSSAAMSPEPSQTPVGGARESGKDIEGPEQNTEDGKPRRMPRNVQAFYLQPLRRVAQYGVPSCDLQLRSYSVRPLESFCDFALRAAYYLGLPAYGPVPLPKITERWTVPKSNFIHKKSQENFERITRRRLIQIKDGHPETVQIWLAFLQKHQQAAVGLKANLWEFSSVDVAKQLDEAFKEAEPLINEKARFLGQNKEFATMEKVDEFLQSEKYRLVGGQFSHKEERIGS